jgi:hypothetical protein
MDCDFVERNDKQNCNKRSVVILTSQFATIKIAFFL